MPTDDIQARAVLRMIQHICANPYGRTPEQLLVRIQHEVEAYLQPAPAQKEEQ